MRVHELGWRHRELAERSRMSQAIVRELQHHTVERRRSTRTQEERLGRITIMTGNLPTAPATPVDREPGREGTWIAARWQRQQSTALVDWRSSARSLAHIDLSTLCEAISATVKFISRGGSRLAQNLPAVLKYCDKLAFDTDDQVAAYAILHLADRYGRVMQVLERLFEVGHLPIRRSRLSALEVGAGPAPALYAVHDFYADLALWSECTGQGVDFTSVTDLHALDRGPAWSHLLHHLSENLYCLRQKQLTTTTPVLPFHIEFTDFRGFSVSHEHRRALEARARGIIDIWDMDLGEARQLAQQEGVSVPSAYDIVVACNFLTSTEITQQFRREIRELAYGLTPGGLLVLLGGTGAHYPKVWAAVSRIIHRAGLTRLAGFEQPISANENPLHAYMIRQQNIRDLTKIGREAGPLPDILQDLNIMTPFPRFKATVWKNQRSVRKHRTHRQSGSRRA